MGAELQQWDRLRQAKELLRTVRGMIAEDTSFMGAILRVEIDRWMAGENIRLNHFLGDAVPEKPDVS